MSEHAEALPKAPGLRFRQVHLDFHTSPLIPAVADDFEPDAWARQLRDAHINSITCFATCHHGMSYYPTRVGFMHPHLKRDLLGEQIEAAHRHGIKVPVYITVVWSEHQAEEHPEWRQVHRDGSPVGRAPVGPLSKHGWHWLCMNSPYADHVSAVTDEVLSSYAADGLFFDIVMSAKPGCCCAYCLRGMLEAGVDPEDDAALHGYTLGAERRFMERISREVWAKRPGLPLYFNARMRLTGEPVDGNRPEAPYFSHWELESLPTGGWGYTHFALYNRFFQTLGKPILGMTAAFHRSWADFGTVKSQAALDYECFRALAGGAACSVGDQLHPRGTTVAETYRRLGATYASVEAKEPWCRGAVPLAEVAILLPSDSSSWSRVSGLESEDGALHMLLESGYQAAVVDSAADFAPYRVIVAPDHARLSTELAANLRSYVIAGGSLLLSHESGLSTEGKDFALGDLMGVEYLGASRDDVEFFRPLGELAAEIPVMDHALYDRGSAVRSLAGTEVLGEVVSPYFSRTWAHFSSHAQTPPNPVELPGLVAASIRGRVVYLSNPLFRSYQANGYPVYRQIVTAILHRLLPDPLVQTNLPTTGEVTVLHQPAGADGNAPERLICHILHYVPQRRAPDLDLVEDVIPLFDVTVEVRTGWEPRAVYLAPERTALVATMHGDYACVSVPKVTGHAMVVFERGR